MKEYCTDCGLCREHCNCPQEAFDVGASYRDAEWWAPEIPHCRECSEVA